MFGPVRAYLPIPCSEHAALSVQGLQLHPAISACFAGTWHAASLACLRCLPFFLQELCLSGWLTTPS